MSSGIEWNDWARLDANLAAITNYDATPLMHQWTSILSEGNRVGILKGIDGNNNPMPALRYRTGKGRPTKKRRVPDFGTTLHASHGENLSTSEYRELTGPRLAPRGEKSRVIANLYQEVRAFPSDHRWEAVCAWFDVVSAKGVPFLEYHFNGAGHNPKYDLRPIRDVDMQYCLNALRAFAKQVFFDNF